MFPATVRYYPDTGRVTVYWKARPSGNREHLRMAILCPPNDVRKRRLVEQFVESHQDAPSVRQELYDDGLEPRL